MDLNRRFDPDHGEHYASQFTSIPNGTYEGQLVIGDSLMLPVKKFTIEKDSDIIMLQFEVTSGGRSVGGEYHQYFSNRGTTQIILLTQLYMLSSSDFDSSYSGHYGSGYMQKNPSYNQSSSYSSSYSYQNPAFGHGTSIGLRSYAEEGGSSRYLGEGYRQSGDYHHSGM